ncbi:MAG: nitroreductase family protein [Rikenellaceae bacterium]
MEFIEAMRLRYATKLYDHTKQLDDAIVVTIAEILRLTPSSINSQPWHFTLVTDPLIKSELAKSSYFNAERIEAAPLLVVMSICNNVDSFENRIVRELPQPNVEYYNSILKPHGEEYIKQWFTSQLYIALGVLLSACATMNLDSTPMEGIDHKIYDSILEQKEHRAIVAVAIGYRSLADKNQPEITLKQRRDMDDKTEVI